MASVEQEQLMDEVQQQSLSSSHSTTHTPSSSHRRTSSSTISPFLIRKNAGAICAAEDDLPTSSISNLWKRPLKLGKPATSPLIASSQGQANRRTPTRRKTGGSAPPIKLFNDGDSSVTESLPGFAGFNVMRSERSRAAYRRSLSHPEPANGGADSDYKNPKRAKLFDDESSPYEEFQVKKPDSGLTTSRSSSTSLTPSVRQLKLFAKSQSDSHLTDCNITSALEKIASNSNLIGDGSKDYVLPIMTIGGKNPDLKQISPDTLASLLENKEETPHVSYKIIDCRYPYEYEGGHIRGAVNYYTQSQVEKELIDLKTALTTFEGESETIREVLIFHCEFSSHRGPTLCRHLRERDRNFNATSYPFLFYPELYVLFGGYKDFYAKYPHLCDPEHYTPMDHPDHKTEYKRYKSKPKFTRMKSTSGF